MAAASSGFERPPRNVHEALRAQRIMFLALFAGAPTACIALFFAMRGEDLTAGALQGEAQTTFLLAGGISLLLSLVLGLLSFRLPRAVIDRTPADGNPFAAATTGLILALACCEGASMMWVGSLLATKTPWMALGLLLPQGFMLLHWPTPEKINALAQRLGAHQARGAQT